MATLEITTGGKEYVPGAATVFSNAFKTDPTINYLLSSLPAAERELYRPKFFQVLASAAILNGGTIEEIDDFKSCGIMMPPGKDVGNPLSWVQAGFVGMLWKLGIGGVRKMLNEIEPLKEGPKAKALLTNERYYYVFFLGTDEEARGRGIAPRS
ncbi:putative N-acetyltransferase [Lachnellula suecica]|uniref:Putative N-acetyltransferase n=1 Tax=Lachnellula suecica TaxID=602035 RepID=A0A8T9C817_9HELO|nr:putative N-acetyltransferase [Lachnellula suecica]